MSLASIASAAALLAEQAVLAPSSSASAYYARASPPTLAFVSTAERRRTASFGHRPRRPRSNCISRAPACDNRSLKLKQDVHVLQATIDDGALQTDIVERLELTDQFERWRFLQKLLEGELPASDVEDVLLLSLSAYLKHGPTVQSADNTDENGGNASPVLTEEQRAVTSVVIDRMMTISDGIGDSRFLHMLVSPPVDYESITIDDEDVVSDKESGMIKVDPGALSILEGIERLLPDPVEDEEAFKSAWDVIIDLHGRESVRVREEALQQEKEAGGVSVSVDGGGEARCSSENLQWRTLCAVGRVLVHYDFLTKGVLKEGAFR